MRLIQDSSTLPATGGNLLARLVAALSICASLAILSPIRPAAATDSGGGLSIAPVSANPTGGVTNRSTFQYKLDPGAKQADAVVVSNLSNEDKTVVVYIANAFTTTGGLLGVRSNDQAKSGPVEWLKFTTQLPNNKFTLKALTSLTIPFLITIPPNAPPGDYAFGIAVAPDSVEVTPADGKNTVQILQAAASLVELRVAGPLIPIVRVGSLRVFSVPKLIPGFIDGSTKVTFEVVNVGNQRIDAVIHLTERNMFNGLIHQEPEIKLGNLLPGSRVTLTRSWDNTPYIKGSVKVDIRSGTSINVSRSANFWSVSWRTFVAPAIIVAAFFIIRWRIRRRRRNRDAADLAALEAITRPERPTSVVGLS